MKLRLSSETTKKLRKLANVYDVSIQSIARAASIRQKRLCREIETIKNPTTTTNGSVIDVGDDYTQREWRAIIDLYCDEELLRIDDIIKALIADERIKADTIKASLPNVNIKG